MRRRDTRAALLMLLHAAILAAVFMLYPIVQTFWMSLNRVNQFGQIKEFVGVDNYLRLVSDTWFQQAFWRTVVWTVSVVSVTTLVALFLAQSVMQTRPNGRFSNWLQPHLISGLYIDDWFTRVTFRLWPPGFH